MKTPSFFTACRHFPKGAVGLLLVLSGVPLRNLPAQNTPPAPVPAAAANTPAPAGDPAAADPAGDVSLDPLNPEQLRRYSLDRYEKIIEKSPFAFKIVREEGPPPISFAADMALAGFTIDAGKGITYATLVDKKSNARFVIRTDRPNADGIQLVQLNRGQTLLESAVVARKGSEEATIKSDQQIIERKAVVNAAVVGQPVQAMNVPGRGGPPGANVNLAVNPNANRGQNVQQQINAQLQQPGAVPGQPVPQPGGLPPGAVQGGAVPTVGDQSVQAAQPQPQAQPQGRPGQTPGRRRVILPPAQN